MFSPDADMSPYHPRTSKAKASDDLGIITHVNTRLTEQDEGDSQSRAASAPPSPTRSRIDAAITGTPCKFYFTSVIFSSNHLTRSTAVPHQ